MGKPEVGATTFAWMEYAGELEADNKRLVAVAYEQQEIVQAARRVAESYTASRGHWPLMDRLIELVRPKGP